MKIATNMIGNYTPYIYNKKTEMKTSETSAVSNQNIVQANKTENLTKAEKDYFGELYPNNTSEIKDYHYYDRNGQMSGVKVGSLIDRRG